jgi:hypothetical protein
MSNDSRTSRTNTVRFAHGTVTLLVDHWSISENDAPSANETDIAVDHLMGTLYTGVLKTVDNLNLDVLRKDLDVGVGTHCATRSMTINGRTMRAKVTFAVTRDVPSYVLALMVDELLSGVTPCIIHLLDDSLKEDDKMASAKSMLSSLLGAFGDDPSGLFGSAGSQFADFGGRGGYGGGHTASEAPPNTGQYL